MKPALIFGLIFMFFGCTTKHIHIHKLTRIVENPSQAQLLHKLARENVQNIVFVYSVDDKGALAGTASGFIVDKDGLIATAKHFVLRPEAKRIFVVFRENKELIKKESIVSYEAGIDLAVIKIDHKFQGQVKLAENWLTVWEPVFSMGYPLTDVDLTMIAENPPRITSGNFYTKINESFGLEGEKVLTKQLLAMPVVVGASGSPVFNLKGEVVGLVSASKPVVRHGYAFTWSIPVGYLKILLKLVKTRGK